MNNGLLDSDHYQDTHAGAADREISLGTPTILGIFFALALVCAVFFGFGYTLGHKSAQAAVAPPPLSTTTTAASTAPIVLKPSAGSVASLPTPVEETASATQEPTQPSPLPASRTATVPASPIVLAEKSPATAPVATSNQQPATGNLQQPAISPSGTFMVQIAAVSTQDIADIEVVALKKYGFDVVVRHLPQDQLLHVQMGPYATKKDAVAMQQIILAHGFNAIVK